MWRTILSALILSFLLSGCVSLPMIDRSSKSEAHSQPAQPAQQDQQAQTGADAAQGSKEAPPQQDAAQPSGQEQAKPSVSEPEANQTPATESKASSAPSAATPEEPAAEPEKKIYVIKKGDSLWSIACNELKDCYRWQEIQHANPALDPKDIQPGQKLTLP